MGHLPALSLRQPALRGRDPPLWHQRRVPPPGPLPADVLLHLQAPHTVQRPAGGPLPFEALLLGPRPDPCRPCGGAAVRREQHGPVAGAGAAGQRQVPTNFQRAGRRGVPVHGDGHRGERWGFIQRHVVTSEVRITPWNPPPRSQKTLWSINLHLVEVQHGWKKGWSPAGQVILAAENSYCFTLYQPNWWEFSRGTVECLTGCDHHSRKTILVCNFHVILVWGGYTNFFWDFLSSAFRQSNLKD